MKINNDNITHNPGFTLIETLLYIALFAVIIGGGMIAAYGIIEATNANTNQIILQEEANFLFRKIEWALTGSATIITPATATPTSNLVVDKNIGGVLTRLTFTKNVSDPVCPVNYLCLKRGLGASQLNANLNQLNSSSFFVSNISFTRTLAVNGRPDAMNAAFTLITVQNGRAASQDFSFTKYLRK